MSSHRVRPLAATAARPLLVAALAALFITGCSPQQWGTAARVGESRITVQELQAATQEVLAVPVQRAPAQGQVLERLVQLEVISVAAGRNGVVATDAEVADAVAAMQRDPNIAQSLAQEGFAPGRQTDVARADVLLRKLGEKLQQQQDQSGNGLLGELARVADDVGVEVNPRYGRYEAAAFALSPLVSGDLARPAPASSPTPDVAPEEPLG